MAMYSGTTWSSSTIRYTNNTSDTIYYENMGSAPAYQRYESTYVSLFHLSSTRKPGYEDLIFEYQYSAMTMEEPNLRVRIKTLEEVSRELKIKIREKDLFDMGVPPEILFIIGDEILASKYKISLRDGSFFYSYRVRIPESSLYFYFTQLMIEEIYALHDIHQP